MPTAAELLKAADLEGAYAALIAEVKQRPTDVALRTLLFQVQCLRGEWDKAGTAIDVVGDLDAKSLYFVQECKAGLLCEKLRAEVFAGERTPMVMGKPSAWVGELIQAAMHTCKGEVEAGAALRAQAFEAAPTSRGVIRVGPTAASSTEHRFEWIADADERLGPMLECLVEAKYYWSAWSNIKSVSIDPPTVLRDSYWLPARIEWAAGGVTPALIPVRYPGSEASRHQGPIRLGRATAFVADGPGGTERVYGQRMIATDVGEFPILDVRSITIESSDVEV